MVQIESDLERAITRGLAINFPRSHSGMSHALVSRVDAGEVKVGAIPPPAPMSIRTNVPIYPTVNPENLDLSDVFKGKVVSGAVEEGYENLVSRISLEEDLLRWNPKICDAPSELIDRMCVSISTPLAFYKS